MDGGEQRLPCEGGRGLVMTAAPNETEGNLCVNVIEKAGREREREEKEKEKDGV